jgi:tubulin monoglycylase TTLL3/8
VTSEQIARKKYEAYLAQIESTDARRKKKRRDKPAAPREADSELLSLCERVLEECADPQRGLAGEHNIWILKPAGLSRGRGIIVLNTIAEIEDHLRYKESQWVIQKYIENPLIMRGRKFDIRLWVVTTDFNPLTIWAYEECYVRFGSADYCPEDIRNKFAHLTNNSINAKNKQGDDSIPGNMWSQEEFVQYLTELEGTDVFEQRIRPQMERIVKLSLMSALDSIENRKFTHEMFGYDFMVDEDYQVWLIEVNSSPSMEYSTHVTKRLVKQGLRDLAKVVIDWQFAPKKLRKKVDTGGFKLIYKGVEFEERTNNVGINLLLEGKPLKKGRPLAKVKNLEYPA